MLASSYLKRARGIVNLKNRLIKNVCFLDIKDGGSFCKANQEGALHCTVCVTVLSEMKNCRGFTNPNSLQAAAVRTTCQLVSCFRSHVLLVGTYDRIVGKEGRKMVVGA